MILLSCNNQGVFAKDSRWVATMLDVASLTSLHSRFYLSTRIFSQGDGVYQGMEYEFIAGDADIDIEESAIIHVTGNLLSNVSQPGHSELIVAGDIGPESRVTLDGIARVYVGGDLQGTIISNGSLDLIVKGNVTGSIVTGDPSTDLTVHGDFSGRIRPKDKDGSLVAIRVYGYTDITHINQIYSHEYTQLTSAFHISNKEPGIHYPDEPYGDYYVIKKQL